MPIVFIIVFCGVDTDYDGKEERMEKKISYSGLVVVVLAVAVLVMSVGFAVFSTNLSINGTAQVSSSSWQVEFDESSYEETVGSVSPTSDPEKPYRHLPSPS